MPDEALAGSTGQHALDDLVGALVLLVAADDLETPAPVVGGEEGEVGQDVEDDVRTQQRFDLLAYIGQRCGHGLLVEPPRPPLVHRRADGAVAHLLAFGGHAEYVAGEEFGHEAFVVVVDLERAVHPTDGVAHRRLGLDQHQGKAVDQQHHIGAAFGGPGAEGVLGGEDILVVVQILEVDELDRDVLVVGAKGHGLLVAQPAGEEFVGVDEALAAHGQHDGAQLVDHLVGAVGLGGDGWVEADERFAYVLFDEDILRLAGQGDGRDEMPACAAAGPAGGDVGFAVSITPGLGAACLPQSWSRTKFSTEFSSLN